LLALTVLCGCGLWATRDDEAPPPADTASAPAARAEARPLPASLPPATRIERVTIEPAPPSSRVVIELDGFVEPEVSLLVNHRLVLDVPDTTSETLPRVIEASGDPLVERVRVGQHAAPATKSRVVIDLRTRADFTVRAQGDRIVVLLAPGGSGPVLGAADAAPADAPHFLLDAEPSAAPPAPPELPEPTATPAWTSAPSASESPSATPAPPEPSASPSPEAPAATAGEAASATPVELEAPAAVPAPAETAELATAPLEPLVEATRARADDATLAVAASAPATQGKRISIDFTETDLRTVIELIASAGGYRVMFTPEVAGVVSVTLVDRDWEDALTTVLRAKQLREVRHEDVMLVSPQPRGNGAARRPAP